ncbi:MAG: DsbA family protein, partial [Candidatus Mariimomonas ferrooxydans]
MVGEKAIYTLANSGVNLGENIISGNIIYPPSQNPPLCTPSTPSPSPQPSGGTLNVADLIDDDSFMGDSDAPVTIIEFSDFQCPFCRRSYTDTLPQIKANYVDTGKVKLVYRDFPLSFHPAAQPAAEAFECAEEQGKEWELHDKLFDEQNAQGSG